MKKFPHLTKIMYETPNTVIDNNWYDILVEDGRIEVLNELSIITNLKSHEAVFEKHEGKTIEELFDTYIEDLIIKSWHHGYYYHYEEINGEGSSHENPISVMQLVKTELGDDYYKTEEKTIPITLATIKNTCGWGKYCDVTGGNHYMLKEWSVEDSEIFRVKESHAKELGLIK